MIEEEYNSACMDNIEETPEDIESIINKNELSMHEKRESRRRNELCERTNSIKERRQYIYEQAEFEKEKQEFNKDKENYKKKKAGLLELDEEDQQLDELAHKIIQAANHAALEKQKEQTLNFNSLHETLHTFLIEDIPLEPFNKLSNQEREEIINMYKHTLTSLPDKLEEMTEEQAHNTIRNAINKQKGQIRNPYQDMIRRSKR